MSRRGQRLATMRIPVTLLMGLAAYFVWASTFAESVGVAAP
jgi:hypothetical protein